MKKPNKITGLVLIALFAMGCSKGDSSTGTPSPTGGPITQPSSESHGINATEQRLLGRWMITQERDTVFDFKPDGSIDKVRPGTPRDNQDPAFFYEFKADDALVTFGDFDYGHKSLDTRRSTSGPNGTDQSQWIYDDAQGRLYILYTNSYFKILSLTDTDLYLVEDQTIVDGQGKFRSVKYERFTKIK